MGKKNRDLDSFDFDTLWANFDNNDAFTYLKDELIIMSSIYAKLHAADLKPIYSRTGEVETHPVLRRLNFMLMKKNKFTICCPDNHKMVAESLLA